MCVTAAQPFCPAALICMRHSRPVPLHARVILSSSVPRLCFALFPRAGEDFFFLDSFCFFLHKQNCFSLH